MKNKNKYFKRQNNFYYKYLKRINLLKKELKHFFDGYTKFDIILPS